MIYCTWFQNVSTLIFYYIWKTECLSGKRSSASSDKSCILSFLSTQRENSFFKHLTWYMIFRRVPVLVNIMALCKRRRSCTTLSAFVRTAPSAPTYHDWNQHLPVKLRFRFKIYYYTRQESSMINSASPQSRPAVIIAWFWSFGTDGRTNGWTDGHSVWN